MTTARTWLITGADKGLGRSTAEAALARGDNVVVTVLAPDGSHPLSAQHPERFRAIHLDARDLQRVPAVVAQAERAFGGIDVLVNNAGYGLIGLAEETPPEKYRPLFEVNFFGLVEMTRAVLPGMRARRSGHVINLSSVAGYAGTLGFSFYCAAKHAVEGYSESLAKEVKPLGIHVTIIEPGGFRSDFAGPSLATEGIGIDDYAPAAGAYIRDYAATRHGKQPNDPALFGPAMLRLVDAKDPPLRLPLGRDGYEYVRDNATQVLQEIERWKDLSFSTTVSA
jgi:NAD(P)-dependent dehydrogenase (short-subunit alcohol dehydrogenase family)